MSRHFVRTVLASAGLCLAPGVARAAAPPSPAERHVARAERTIKEAPGLPDGYNELALALARRARETADPAFYARAVEAAHKSLSLAPDNVGALKAKAWALLGQHDFAAALQIARALNLRVPDDVMVYGLLTDAYVELGRYDEAEKACQWMLDLRPGNVPGLTRAAYLRELFGNVPGALALMREALEQVPAGEAEDRAWMLAQIGHLHLLQGKAAEAERALEESLALFPGYHYALGTLARVRTAQGRHADAVRLLRARQRTAAHPENLYELAEALERAGARAQARRAFAEFEQAALRESAGPDNSNRELIFHYTDHEKRPAEALRIAEAEVARRRDVHTLDAYAWALAANGRAAEARRAIEEALAVGVRDPRIRRHAEVIASRSKRAR